MSSKTNVTHDPNLSSWVQSANSDGTDFPIQNLPFGVFRSGERIACGVAIGDYVLDVSACSDAFSGKARDAAQACNETSLNRFMGLGNVFAGALRAQLSALLSKGNEEGEKRLRASLHRIDECDLLAPVRVSGYTDFFASIHHATNAGKLFRPDAPLLPNYKFVPIAYNGRANSVRVSGIPVTRPCGQTKTPQADEPTFGPAKRLDYEVELGAYVGAPSSIGSPVTVEGAWQHIFGFTLLNDWSARDIQAWEYQPLGPFLAKTFATTVSPWVVTAEALAPFRSPMLVRQNDDPAPLPYLYDAADQAEGSLSISLEVHLRSARMLKTNIAPVRMSRSNTEDLYWSFAQMLAHHTSNGSALDTGDLMGSGTVSGSEKDALGSLLEITRGGSEPHTIDGAHPRTWLEDGDEVTLRGYCERTGFRRIGFGNCSATLLPARVSEDTNATA